MRKWIVAALVALAPALVIGLAPLSALAGAADGVWKTGTDSEGGYLEVTIAPCASDTAKSCGTITKAFSKTAEDPGYANIGKPIIEDMEPDGDDKFSGGTIWNPEDGKTYNSKLILKGDTLEVDGCVMFFCQEQDWSRVK